MKWNIRKVTGLAMVAAISYAVMLMGFRFIPSANYLKYEAKDVILTIGGFIYGPVGALAAAFVVALTEMMTISETLYYGFIMNFAAAAAFAGVASLIYAKVRTIKGAVLGLVFGSLSMTAVMMLLNYVITPVYTGMPREAVAAMLVPVFMPFNLIKAGLNSALIMLIYKPLTEALRYARLLPGSAPGNAPGYAPGGNPGGKPGVIPGGKPGSTLGAAPKPAGAKFAFKINTGVYISAFILLAACAAVIYFIFNK